MSDEKELIDWKKPIRLSNGVDAKFEDFVGDMVLDDSKLKNYVLVTVENFGSFYANRYTGKIDFTNLSVINIPEYVVHRKPIDIKYIGVPNICFSLTEENDDREKLYSQQRIERGFDNSELWSLEHTIARFIIPRLKAFKENSVGYPGCFKNEKEWEKVLNKMIRAFELVVRDEGSLYFNDKEEKEYNQGMNAFKNYFLCLWI